jgi:hypothetical protein
MLMSPCPPRHSYDSYLDFGQYSVSTNEQYPISLLITGKSDQLIATKKFSIFLALVTTSCDSASFSKIDASCIVDSSIIESICGRDISSYLFTAIYVSSSVLIHIY